MCLKEKTFRKKPYEVQGQTSENTKYKKMFYFPYVHITQLKEKMVHMTTIVLLKIFPLITFFSGALMKLLFGDWDLFVKEFTITINTQLTQLLLFPINI